MQRIIVLGLLGLALAGCSKKDDEETTPLIPTQPTSQVGPAGAAPTPGGQGAPATPGQAAPGTPGGSGQTVLTPDGPTMPKGMPSGFPTTMPSGFPTAMPSGFPTTMPSGFPTAITIPSSIPIPPITIPSAQKP